MKYLLIMHMNPAVMSALSEEQRTAIMDGHEGFIKAIRESGELIGTHALADPDASAVVRINEGTPVVTDGPYAEAKEYLAGYYLVECASKDRALELAGMIPDATIPGLGIEVRPVIFSAGPEA